MTRAQVMQWLLTLGKDWVGLHKLFYEFNTYDDEFDLWEVLSEWHDGAYITKRFNNAIYEKRMYSVSDVGIEQYKLTKKALTLLGTEKDDE